MKISEELLLHFCRKPGTDDFRSSKEDYTLGNALSLLCRVYPNFMDRIVNKEILDFGCGSGYQTIAMAQHGAKFVLGLDTNQKALEKARNLATGLGLLRQVEFKEKLRDDYIDKFDMVISQNSMEHFNDPIKVLNDMKSALKKDGTIFITFGPPWFAPYGSHMQFFTKVPWVNILFSEKTVMNVRSHFRQDGARRYEEVESGLNKMTLTKFERLTSYAGLKVEHTNIECIKGINSLCKLPVLRELFVNHISYRLRK